MDVNYIWVVQAENDDPHFFSTGEKAEDYVNVVRKWFKDNFPSMEEYEIEDSIRVYREKIDAS